MSVLHFIILVMNVDDWIHKKNGFASHYSLVIIQKKYIQ